MKNKYENWPTEKIKSEMELMNQVLRVRREVQQVKDARQKCINNITTKDFVVYWGLYDICDEGEEDDYIQFSFCIKHGGEVYDIYYQYSEHEPKGDDKFYPWWPLKGDPTDSDWERNAAFEFIPRGFCEACENSYEYRGTFEEAVAQLRTCGFEDIQRAPTDNAELTGKILDRLKALKLSPHVV